MTHSAPLILLAEDDLSDALILMEALEGEGYTVVHARNGRHAVALLEVVRPTVIVTSLMMPGMDGLALLQHVAARPAPRPRVLAISAFQGYLEKAVELGASATLARPFELDDLLRAVRAAATGAATAARCPPLDERQRLRAVVEMQLEEPSPSEALQRFVERTARIFDVPVCLVSIVTRDRQHWHAQTGLPDDLAAQRGTPRDQSFCTHAVAAQAALVVVDALDNPFFADNVLVRERGLRFYAGVPLITRHGLPLGTLCLLDFQPRRFGAFDLELLALLSRRVLAELEWRERRLRPGTPHSAFRHLSWLDEELDVLGREAFEQALQLECLRAAEQRRALTLLLLEPGGDLPAAVGELKVRLPRSLLGRLESRRIGVVVPDVAAAEVAARARAATGDGCAVRAVEVPRLVGGIGAFLRDAERELRGSPPAPPVLTPQAG
jgi:CheY-like chemotaxis protein